MRMEHEEERYYLETFCLYETASNFYMVGSDKSGTFWRVLTINRSEPSELNIHEDSITYSESECNELLNHIHEENMPTGGLKFVTSCYGIVGFIKFLGPYYMLLITERKEIGSICGHMVYAVAKSELVALRNPTFWSVSKDENRYKKLLCSVDLTKDFFFSYSYNVMCSLQKTLCDGETRQDLYETMFVWNEFLTRGIRNLLKNTLWTVAMVYGYFKQAKFSISGKDFNLALIARRSRHYAGTRYLKRGVNEKGDVANDVETEQIVFEDRPGEIPVRISSIVQNRGSIPLYWSQETSPLNIKPDILLQRKDRNYEATRLHFDNLVKRYGNPIVIVNLIKTQEKRPRESILHEEFSNAIDTINKDLSEENHLKFLHWDLNKHSRSNATKVLAMLGKVAACALNQTGFFYCQMMPVSRLQNPLKWPIFLNDDANELADSNHHNDSHNIDGAANSNSLSRSENTESCLVKSPKFQKGVLRTNCIDCLDRTNAAQYAYGLAALGNQLHSLGFRSSPKIDVDAPLAHSLMDFYEAMGDTLALQYGGSAAHNKIFAGIRGQWKAATQSHELLRTLQRYYNNVYMDEQKQNAINLFLGHLQPSVCDNEFLVEKTRSFMKRSLSDGNFLRESDNTPISRFNGGHSRLPNSATSAGIHEIEDAQDLSKSAPEISPCESDISYSRYTPTMGGRHLFGESAHSYFSKYGSDGSARSNFLDPDWLSYEDEPSDRSTITNSPVENLSTENVLNGLTADTRPAASQNGSGIKGKNTMGTHTASSNNDTGQNSNNLGDFPDSFVHWVINGETLCY